jgi:hypothetical protein
VRYIIIFISFLFLQNTVAATNNCEQHLISPNWPNDKLDFAVDCKFDKVVSGENPYRTGYSFDICFGVVRTEFSKFKDKNYITLRYAKDGGRLQDIGDKVAINGDEIKVTSYHRDIGTTGRKFKNETVLNTRTMELYFNEYKEAFFSYELWLSTRYLCELVAL